MKHEMALLSDVAKRQQAYRKYFKEDRMKASVGC